MNLSVQCERAKRRLEAALAVMDAHRALVIAYDAEHNKEETRLWLQRCFGVTVGKDAIGHWLKRQPEYRHGETLAAKRLKAGRIGKDAVIAGHKGTSTKWQARRVEDEERLAQIRATAREKLAAGRAQDELSILAPVVGR